LRKPCEKRCGALCVPKDRIGDIADPTRDVVRQAVGAREHHGPMTAPTVEAAINDLMDRAWNVVYDLLVERGLLGDGLDVQEYTGIHSWVDGLTRYTIVHSRAVAVLFVDTRPLEATPFHHDLFGADAPKVLFPSGWCWADAMRWWTVWRRRPKHGRVKRRRRVKNCCARPAEAGEDPGPARIGPVGACRRRPSGDQPVGDPRRHWGCQGQPPVRPMVAGTTTNGESSG
jgi:hypothetical protein